MTDTPATRRDPAPPASSAATTRDAAAPSASPSTMRDGAGFPNQAAPPTVRDGARPESAAFVRVNLPSALQGRYRPLYDLPWAGAEADLVVADAVDGSGTWIVKVYRPGIELDGALLDTIASAGSAHVVGSREHGRSDSTWYEVLEHVHEGSLADLLRATSGRLPEARVREILVELHSALTALQRLGVVHRDLKPDNVLVRTTAPLDLVLADFGLATVVERSWRLASASRTLAYAAPESAHGHVSPARDWWSLGLIVLEALTGEQPLVGLDDAVVSIHLATRCIDVRGVADERWRLLCRGLLTRDPALRWGAEQVAAWLAGERPKVAVESETVPSSSARPYVFDGRSCMTPRELAIAMARSWKEAARQFVADGLAFRSLTTWLLAQTSDGDLAARLDDLSTYPSPDKRVAALVWALAPDLNPAFRTFELHGDGLAELARAARGKVDGAEAEVVRLLLDQQILKLYPSLAATAASWTALHTTVQQRLAAASAAGAGGNLDEQARVALAAFTLQLTVDPTAQEELSRQHQAIPAGAHSRDWFRALGDDPAGQLTRVLLAPTANGQHRDAERAVEEGRRRAQQERQRKAEAARRQAEQRRLQLRTERRSAALGRRATDWAAIWLGVIACATVLVPWLLGAFVLRGSALIGHTYDATVFDGAVRKNGAYFMADWTGGCTVIAVIIAAFVLLRSWTGRSLTIIVALLVATGAIGVLRPFSMQRWAEAEARAASELKTTAFPFDSHFFSCGSAQVVTQSNEPYSLFTTRLAGSSTTFCNRVELYRGWRRIAVKNLDKGQNAGGVTALPGKDLKTTTFEIQLVEPAIWGSYTTTGSLNLGIDTLMKEDGVNTQPTVTK